MGLKITAISCVKDEGPFILEWVAFNRLIGVTDFLVYSNDCSDHGDALLDALHPAGVVHLPNPAQGRNYHMEALAHARSHPVVIAADWLWITDLDEFLNVRVGAGTIPDLIGACGNPGAISPLFRYFANAGVERFEDRPVIGQFTRCHNPNLWTDRFDHEVKTLTRTDVPVQYFGAHRPFLRKDIRATDLPGWTDGSGRPVPRAFIRSLGGRQRSLPARGAHDFATLHHYALRSLDSYLVKSARGDAMRAGRRIEVDYWRDRNDAAVEDRSILHWLPKLDAEIAGLKALPGAADLHARAVTAHRSAIAGRHTDPAGCALASSLRSASPLPCAEEAAIRQLGLPLGGIAHA